MEKLVGSVCLSPKDPNDPGSVLPTENPKEPMPAPQTPEPQRWREVAAQAAIEADPQRLTELVDELIRLLDEERRGKSKSIDRGC
jgi:hypothetical protein